MQKYKIMLQYNRRTDKISLYFYLWKLVKVMSSSPVLAKLKERKAATFKVKQAAYKDFDEARTLARAAHEEVELAKKERAKATDVLNQEFEAMVFAREHQEESWAEFRRLRDKNKPQIDVLKAKLDTEHAALRACHSQSKAARLHGNHVEAAGYGVESRDHEDNINALECEIDNLHNEIESARAYAVAQNETAKGTAFHQAKLDFEAAKKRHQEAYDSFKQLNAERQRLYKVFEEADADFIYARNELDYYYSGGKI